MVTIGIPTYDRPDHLNRRLIDLGKMGYFNHPEVQIIIHDNDSTKKEHITEIKNIQKTVTNLELIESSPNIGMVNGCWKIISNAKGDWIMLLGDDDPIIMKCCHFLNLIKKNQQSDHLYFQTKVHRKGKISRVPWFPKLKRGNYKTSMLCANTGFTTHFAFLGSHCFRNKEKMAEIWIKSHKHCMFYGHCVMLLENHRRSFFTGETVAAWNEGNERISHQLNLMRHLELRNLFKYPTSKGIRKFIRLKPWEVVKQGRFPLLDHITHPLVDFFHELEQQPKKNRITLSKISTISFNPKGKVLIAGAKKVNEKGITCLFVDEKHAKKSEGVDAAIIFRIGPVTSPDNIFRIITKLQLMGRIYHNNKIVDNATLVLGDFRLKTTALLRMRFYALLLLSIFLYGPAGLNQRKIIINYFNRPRRGLYKIIHSLERAIRIPVKRLAKRLLPIRVYYKMKELLIVFKQFPPIKRQSY